MSYEFTEGACLKIFRTRRMVREKIVRPLMLIGILRQKIFVPPRRFVAFYLVLSKIAHDAGPPPAGREFRSHESFSESLVIYNVATQRTFQCRIDRLVEISLLSQSFPRFSAGSFTDAR